jgi:thioredoxin reductase
MATVHLIHEGREVTARKLVLKRHVNIESIISWWNACRRALTGKEVPLEYDSVEVDTAYIRFVCGDTIVFVDRKRDML